MEALDWKIDEIILSEGGSGNRIIQMDARVLAGSEGLIWFSGNDVGAERSCRSPRFQAKPPSWASSAC